MLQKLHSLNKYETLCTDKALWFGSKLIKCEKKKAKTLKFAVPVVQGTSQDLIKCMHPPENCFSDASAVGQKVWSYLAVCSHHKTTDTENIEYPLFNKRGDRKKSCTHSMHKHLCKDTDIKSIFTTFLQDMYIQGQRWHLGQTIIQTFMKPSVFSPQQTNFIEDPHKIQL